MLIDTTTLRATAIPAAAPDRGFGRFVTVRTGIPRSASERLLRGVGWNAAGCIVGQSASFAGSVVAARCLGKEVFGQFALVQTTVAAFSTLAGLGLGTTAMKFVSEYRTSNPQKAGIIMGLSSLVAFVAAALFSVALALCAPWLVVGSVSAHVLTDAMRLSALCMFFITVNGYQMGALSGLEAFRGIASINVAYGLATLVLTWAASRWFGLCGATLAQGLSAALLWLLYHYTLKTECRRRNIVVAYRGAWNERSALYRFSVPSTTACIISSLAIWWSNAALAKASGYAALAVFSAANNMRLMVLFMPIIIGRVTTPLLNNMLAAGDLWGYRKTFCGSVALNGSTAILAATVLALAGRYVLHLFGKEFAGSSALILLLLGAATLEVIASSLYQAVFAGSSLWRLVIINGVWTVVLIATLQLTVSRYGVSALAFSYLAAWSSSVILYGAEAWRRLKQLEVRRSQTFEGALCNP
ncbi:MAG: oligosaccharide flippase family protein [Bryobacteraceae bacterium]